MSDVALVLSEVEAGVARLTLNDGDRRNPLSDPMIDALLDALSSRQVQEAGAVVLRGAGGFFSAGGDIKQFHASLTTDASEQFAATTSFRQLFVELDRLEGLLVSVVEGQALGGGCGIAAASDVVLASSSARFACPEINLGAFPMVITPALVRAMGPRATLAISTSGKKFEATRAQELGLVTEVLDDSTFDEEVAKYIRHLESTPAHVLRLGKLSVRAAERADYQTALESGSLLRSLLFSSPSFHEGVSAFMEDRQSR